jgi:hypothetical protein
LGLQLGRNAFSYGRAPKLLDSRKHYAPMPEQHADVLKVLISQMAKCCETNSVFSKTLRVLEHSELFEPVGNLLHRGPSGFCATHSGPIGPKVYHARRLIPAPAARLHVRSFFESFGRDAVIQTLELGARIMRYELADYEWSAIKPLLPNKPRGVPRVNDRRS